MATEKTLPVSRNMQIIRQLQEVTAPQIFTPRCVYDGRKNLFSNHLLQFPDGGNSAQFEVYMETSQSPGRPDRPAREPRPFRVKIKQAEGAAINLELLHRFVQGQQTSDDPILTAIMALNIVIRHESTSKYSFNSRSFFPGNETRDIGGGIVLWRGIFQSIRPAVGRMLLNLDISTGMMYKPGSLIGLCLEVLGRRANVDANMLAPTRGLRDSDRQQLNRMVAGVKVLVTSGSGNKGKGPRQVSRLTRKGAKDEFFELTLENGSKRNISVAEYFQRVCNRTLRYPDVLCAEVGNGAKIPLELCEVPPGQIMRKQVPSDKTKDVVEFSTKRPIQRFDSIQAGLGVLAYGQSEYVRQFGLNIHTDEGPLAINSRILPAPTLQYGTGSKQINVIPRDGKWNMIDKKFFKPCAIDNWVIVIYEMIQRFGDRDAQDMIKGLLQACNAAGINIREKDPLVCWENAQQNVAVHLTNAGRKCIDKNGSPPQLIVVVLPSQGNTGLYTAVKHFGDVTQGVATQCLNSAKCGRAKQQYFANVCLKINVKRGGINTVPEQRSVPILTDPRNPTIVMGADASHPPPHTQDRPSFTSLVASVDSSTAKYVADCRVQTSRQELIDDLEEMTKGMLEKYRVYGRSEEKRTADPKRLIFFRDGVSEGQFQQVLDTELPRIKAACASLKMKPAITLIVVGKRHHVRFVPAQGSALDQSGNCPAGTVVDTDIINPIEFDYYLQSHAGLLGTSRPAHYNILYDESNFSQDALQSLCYALCHVYARSTRSVSIPAPVYYADIVCERAWNHYNPDLNITNASDAFSTTGSNAEPGDTLQRYQANFQRLHQNMQFNMYFS
ncbi:protein argonaute [Phanerochaete sordida]|uniref:Protein argonaute n=1 Tax=Phanerochaete sordida TaxID=48140 RepID=A0A9P3LBQ4_9APHY|nr:protein argonaute [Phanerochaete sordida]